MTDSRIGYSRHIIYLHVIPFGNSRSTTITGIFHVNPLVIRRRVTVIYPQERTNLFLASRSRHLRDPIPGNLQSLPRLNIPHNRVSQIRERRTFAGHHITMLIFSQNNRRTTIFIPSRINPRLRQDQKGARPLDLVIHVLDSLLKRIPGINQHGHRLCRVHRRTRQFGKMLSFLQKLIYNLVQISQTSDHHDSEPS